MTEYIKRKSVSKLIEKIPADKLKDGLTRLEMERINKEAAKVDKFVLKTQKEYANGTLNTFGDKSTSN